MYYPDYLIHYNKNHSAKNGQFTSGDGDGDGISNDHAHRSKEGKKRQLTAEEIKKRNRKRALIGIGAGLIGTAAAAAAVVVTSNHIKKGNDTVRNYSQMMYEGWKNTGNGRSFCTWLEDVKFIPEIFDMNAIKF